MTTAMPPTFAPMPLKDVTVSRLSLANANLNQQPGAKKPIVIAPIQQPLQQQPLQQQQDTIPSPVRVRRNDPYNWAWRAEVPQVPSPMCPSPNAVPFSPSPSLLNLLPSMSMSQTLPDVVVGSPMLPMLSQPSFEMSPVQSTTMAPQLAALRPDTERKETTATPAAVVCNVLVQFKCHHAEFSSEMDLSKGQYVVVEGDRGVDVGVVIRMNTDEQKQYVERTGPSGTVLRFATQREVDYWASDLKSDEAAALEYCRQRVSKHRLTMDVRHAEYQFDKKKLTFYYEAKSRVDFVTLLKELFREFSCRIWMEKVRMHE